MANVLITGAGLSGLAAASFIAKHGHKTTILEKNKTAGGRVRLFEEQGYKFDMGPSWYWMPDVFEQYFNIFGKKTEDFYALTRLSPSYRVFFGKNDIVDMPSNLDELYNLFERLERGSADKLKKFLKEAEEKYNVGIEMLVHKPGLSLMELMDKDILRGLGRLHLLSSVRTYVRQYFKHPFLCQILEFPVLFLGATPQQTPALYTMMNHADLNLGTWYPKGGMFKIIEAMLQIADNQGVEILYNAEVTDVKIEKKAIKSVTFNKQSHDVSWLVNSADYHHFEQEVLPLEARTYSEKYWNSRTLAPSCFIYYVGVNKKISNLLHHNLFFDADFDLHAEDIYTKHGYPTQPLFYVSCTSKTDETAPVGHENLFILIPMSVEIDDSEAIRKRYFDLVLTRLEAMTGETIRPHIDFYRSYAHRDFKEDYHSFKGNAYGLANTLRQTANLKPSIKSKKLSNLFYTGHLTVPGPGMPPSLISGQVVGTEVLKAIHHS